MRQVWREIRDAINASNEKKTVRLVKEWPDLRMTPPANLGAHSWSGLGGDWRWIHVDGYVNFYGAWATAGQIAREYLYQNYTLPLRASGAQVRSAEEHRQPPLYASVGKWGDGAYIDLKSAYWNIMLTVGWDVDYMAGKYIGRGVPPWSFPLPHNKQARNALLGCTYGGDMTIWTGEEIIYKKAGNRLKNKLLHAVTMDILNGIAYEMIMVGAKYVNTDGYIVPYNRIDEAQAVIEAWGLPSAVKAVGEVEVFGVSSYAVGDYRTKYQWQNAPDFANVNPVNPDWLRDRLYKMSAIRRQEEAYTDLP